MNDESFGNNLNGLEVDDLAENNCVRNEKNEAAKRNVVEKMWLHYYNDELLEKGLITESQYRKMKAMINSRKSSPAKA